MVVTIAIANHKGGTGKTTSTVQTAGGIARLDKHVLVVDLDPQANATRRLGIKWNPAAPIASISEALQATTPGAGAGAVLPCGWEQPEAANIDILPARFDLINREAEAGQVGALRRLHRALDGWTQDYDVVLIDTRPDLGHLVQMGMVAADSVIIATDAGYDSIEAAIRVRDFVTTNATDLYNPNLDVIGVIPNRVRNTAEARYQIEGLTAAFGKRIWTARPDSEGIETFIPEWTRFAEADAANCSLTAWSDQRGRETTAMFDQIANTLTTAIERN
jgi:chromosome partitioning protein